MDKRTIMAIVLSMAVVLIWQLIFAPPRKAPAPVPIDEEVQKALPEQKGKAPEGLEGAPLLAQKQGRNVIVDAPLYHGVFTTVGGRLKSWKLKDYMDSIESVVLWRTTPVRPPEPVEMVSAPGDGNLPLGTLVSVNGEPIGDLVFDVDRENLSLVGDREGAVQFTARMGNGLRVVKRYTFYPEKYRVDVDVKVINGSDNPIRSEVSLEWYGEVGKGGGGYGFAGPAVLFNGNTKQISEGEFRKGASFSSNVKWVADEKRVDDESSAYFLSLMAPASGSGAKAGVRGIENAEGRPGVFESRLSSPEREVPPNGERDFSFVVYMGPKIPERLESLGVEGEKAIGYGRYLGPIEKALLKVLGFTHKITGNYGVDIIILSVLLKVIFWPLSRKSYKSMQEMQKIQPEMKMLQERYKDDRERLNQEMMALYKRRKVSPFGGCLPMLIQFPFLIALYKALPLSFNLRHAPFILWIRDLSAPDTLFVDKLPAVLPLIGNSPLGPLPLLMGVSMLIQQKMSPAMGDPRQAKMMMIMPLIFIFIFLKFPSGLVLYWFVQNILSIGEQYYNKKSQA